MNKKGFTLIEVLAIMVILGIITLVTVPIANKIIINSKKKSEEESIRGFARTIKTNADSYVMLNSTNKYSDYSDFDYKGNDVVCSDIFISDEGIVTLKDCYVVNDKNEVLTAKQISEKNHYNYIDGEVKKIGVNGQNNDKEVLAVTELIKKANNESVTRYVPQTVASHQMYTFSHPATFQTPALVDYRYIGSNPYNYAYFNDELWRIVGIFTVEDENGKMEQRIKLMSEYVYGHIDYDAINCDSSEQNYLNNEFYNNILINNRAKDMIAPAKYYLGRIASRVNAEQTYIFERSTNNDINSWTANVGAIYYSDYLFTYAYEVSDLCYDNYRRCNVEWETESSESWIFQHKVPTFMNCNVYADDISPSVYLKSNVKLLGNHSGRKKDPYQFTID